MGVEIEVLFFAKSRDIVGKKSSSLILPEKLTYKQLSKEIIEAFQLHIIEKSVIVAVNEEFCEEDALIELKSGDQLAVIPPLSGG